MSSLGMTSTEATLRPRNRRLISIEGESHSRARSLSPSASLAEEARSITSSRDVSPLPAAHPSRATSLRSAPSRGAASSRGFQAPSVATRNALFTPGYWETSWSSIQGIASTLLGSDVKEPATAASHSTRRKKPPSHGSKFSFRSTTDEWGPVGSAERHIAQGSQEERLAKLQAKKREALLLANGHSEPNRMGHFKRRASLDEAAASPTDDTADAPVYLHHVQKSDTLAGLSIRYNCPQATIRRANRLYPNDSIQVRTRAYLPVDACGVRGRKVAAPDQAAPHASDLLGNTDKDDELATPTAPQADWTINSPSEATPKAKPAFTTSPTLSVTTNDTTQSSSQPPYVHDAWVMIDHIPEPVEIVRMSRQALGFFPPARRRSQSYTDATPPRSPTHSNLPSNAASLTSSPNRSWTPQDRLMQRHGRSASSPQPVDGPPSTAASYFLSSLSGPGGVGSLSRTSSPGPAMDGLNEFWNKQLTPAAAKAVAAAGVHLPLRHGPPPSSAPRQPVTGLGGGLVAARGSFESVTSAGSELAGRVEGWVRRTGGQRGPGASGLVESDLIELQEGGEDSADSRAGDNDVSARAIEEERLLRERFPVRGRVFEEQSRGRGRVR